MSKNLFSLPQEKLVELTKLTGGLAFLVLGALFISGSTFINDKLTAAVVCGTGACQDQQTSGPSVLTLSADIGTVASGTEAFLSWSATNIEDIPGNITCFGSASGTCATESAHNAYQGSIPVNNASAWEEFNDNSGNSYFVVANDSGTVSNIYKWIASGPAGAPCMGKDSSSACGTPYQGLTTGLYTAPAARDAETITSGGSTYLAVANNGDLPLKIYKWIESPTGESTNEPRGVTPSGANGTYSDRSWAVENNKTVTEIGVYSVPAITLTVKIFKRNTDTNYTVVVSQACSHPGGGWYQCDITDYAVPNDGALYYAGIYSASNMATTEMEIVGVGYPGNPAIGTLGGWNPWTNNTATFRVKYSSAINGCMGDGSTYCGAEYQRIATNGRNPNDLHAVTIGSDQYLLVASDNGTSKVYKWLTAPLGESSIEVGVTGNDNDTVFDRSWSINNGATVTHIGVYSSADLAPTALTVKIARRGNYGSAYNIVVSQTCDHPGGGWYDCDITDYVLPATGEYYAGAHTITGASNNLGVTQINVPRSKKDNVNNTGTGQTYTEDVGAATAMRVRYLTSPPACLGNLNFCGAALQNIGPSGNNLQWESFTNPSGETFVALAGESYNGYIYKWMPGSNCFGNGTTCGTAYQTLDFNSQTYYALSVAVSTINGIDYVTYTLDSGGEGSPVRVYTWTPGTGALCPANGGLGNGTRCGWNYFYQSFGGANNVLSTAQSFDVGSDNYIIFGPQTNTAPGYSVAYKWTPAGSANCSVNGGWGNGSACATVASLYTVNNVFQSIIGPTVTDWFPFTVGGGAYLARAAGGTATQIYKGVSSSCIGDGTSCGASIQNLPNTDSSRDVESYTIDGNLYVVRVDGGGQGAVDTPVYKWMPVQECLGNGTVCAGSTDTAFQRISTNDAEDAEWFTENGVHYLLIANNNNSYETKLYQWMPSCNGGAGGLGSGSSCGVYKYQFDTQAAFQVRTVMPASGPRILIVGSQSGENSAYVYEWMSGSTCFGNGTACGTAVQEIENPYYGSFFGLDAYYYTYALAATTTGGVTYLGLGTDIDTSMETDNGLKVFKWLPAGGTGGLGCFGDNSGCAAHVEDNIYNFENTEIYHVYGIEFGNDPANGDLVMTARANGQGLYAYTFQPPQACFGSGTQCGQFSFWAGFYDMRSGTGFSAPSGERYAVIGWTENGHRVSVYEWMPAPAGPEGEGCYGDGGTCSVHFQNFPQASGVWGLEAFQPPGTSDNYLFAGTNSAGAKLYKWMDASTGGGSTPGCNVTWSNTSGSGALATGNNATNQSTGPITEDTTYTLECEGVAVAPSIEVQVELLSTVNITATDATATEVAGNPGNLRIARTGSTQSALPVQYTISSGAGHATNGTDYASIDTSQVVIPVGDAYVDIPITPLGDNTYEGDETVTLTITSAASYTLGSPTVATVTITDEERDNQVPGITTCAGTTIPNGTTCHFNVIPGTVRKGSTTKVYWNITGLIAENTCAITSSPAVSPSRSWSGAGTSWTDGGSGSTTPAIQSKTVYTLRCTAPDSSASTTSKTVNLLPGFREI